MAGLQAGAYRSFLHRLRQDRRERLAVPLAGAGADLGPGHLPFSLPPGANAVLVDRLAPDLHHELFAELSHATIPSPDVIADLDVDRLQAFGDRSLDFIVASHVIEHVANPFALLADCWRVLKPGGLLLVLLPDRRRTFDRGRPPTLPGTLLWKWRNDVRSVSDAEIVDFVCASERASADAVDATRIELHRGRSIHVHCWTDHEFVESLAQGFEARLPPFQLLDANSSSSDPRLEEFGMLLQKPLHEDLAELNPSVRLRQTWRRFASDQSAEVAAPLAHAAAAVIRHSHNLLTAPAVVAALHALMTREDLQAVFGPFPEMPDALGLAGWFDLVLAKPDCDPNSGLIRDLVTLHATF